MDFKKLLSEVDAIIAKIRVSENDVFLMAAARQKLKAAYDELKGGDNG